MPTARLFSIAVFATLTLASSAPAETCPEECAALGWQTEHADAVVVGTVETAPAASVPGTREARVVVVESIRGRIALGATATVIVPDDGHAAPWTAGARHLVFLRESPQTAAQAASAETRYVTVTGAYGFRVLLEKGPEARFPGIVRDIAATLDDTGAVRDAEALKLLLVGWMDDAEPGIAWSAATDFVRHTDLHERLTEKERVRVVESFRRQPVGKSTKAALALAAAATRHASAAGALVDTLLLPRAAELRSTIAEALGRLDDPAAAQERLIARLDGAGTKARENLLDVLGAVGGAPAVPAARAALEDREPQVRAEAAHALGRIARNVREDDPESRISATTELLALLRAAKSDGEIQAAVWALAQLDDQNAFEALRRAEKSDERESVRRFAAQYLKQPRQELVFD